MVSAGFISFSEISRNVLTKHTPAKCKMYGFAIAIIIGVSGFGVAVIGVVGFWHIGSFSNLYQVDAIILMAVGGGGCIFGFVAGIIRSLRNCQNHMSSVSDGLPKKRYPFLSESPSVNFSTVVGQFNDKSIKKQLNGVYTLSNESKIEKSIQKIEDDNQVKTGLLKCHIGVGALHNFDIIAARRSDYGIIFDFNPNNQEFINQCLEYLKISDSPKVFVEKMIPYLESNLDEYNHYEGYDSPINRIQAELVREASWLWQKDTTGKFQHIKKLAEEGKLVAITQDFCQVQVFRELTRTLEQLGCCIDTLYLSNLYAYIPLTSFYNTLEVLTVSDPIVIHCTSPATCQCVHGCQCPKEQQIGRTWKKIAKAHGGIHLL